MPSGTLTREASPDVAAPTARANVIEVRDLTRRFGEFTAVDRISFEVREGEVFAFLGPNGAGKSTTINMLCTLASPTAGQVTIAGFDVASRPKAVRRNIGLVFQDQTLDDRLTAQENLRFHAVLYRVPRDEVDRRIARVLELVDLSDRRYDLVSEFSGGMARRLEIARALMHVPRVLFLDEPTIGLDPQTRALMWEDVLRLREEANVTVFLTTHYMDEAEYADRIAIIDRGKIVALDTPAGAEGGDRRRHGGPGDHGRRGRDRGAAARRLPGRGRIRRSARVRRERRERGRGADRDGRRARPERARPPAHPRRRVPALHRP